MSLCSASLDQQLIVGRSIDEYALLLSIYGHNKDREYARGTMAAVCLRRKPYRALLFLDLGRTRSQQRIGYDAHSAKSALLSMLLPSYPVRSTSSTFSAHLRPSVAMTLHALLFILASALFLWRIVFGKRPSRPPGPAGYPVVGNLFDMPLGGWEWETFTRWAEQYGTFF